MSVVFMEGFDVDDATELATYKGWVASGSSQTNSFPAGSLGGNAFREGSGAGTSVNDKYLPTGLTTMYLGFRMRWVSGAFTTLRTPLSIQTAAGAVIANFNINTSGFFQINTVTALTGTTPVSTGVWYYVEIYLKIVDSTHGEVQVRLNGVTEIALTTGLNFGTVAARIIELTATGGTSVDFDDMYVCDTTTDPGANPNNTFLGDCYVETLLPTGDGGNTSWTPSTGSNHYAVVDEDPANADTDYVSDSTSGHRDTYTHATPGSGTVYAVANQLIVRKDDAGTRQVASVVRMGGTNYDGTSSSGLSSTYGQVLQIYSGQSPDAADWTTSSVGSAEFGIKVV